MKTAVKVIKKLKVEKSEMKFPDLGSFKDWSIEGHGDAGFKSLPDKMSSCGGRVALVRNVKTGAACVVSWRSRKLKRIVLSSTAAETLALNDTVSEIVYVKAVLKEMLGSVAEEIPMEIFTDSKNLWKAVQTTALNDDPRLRTDLAALKESLENGEVTKIHRISGKEMMADCLTKKGASAKKLMDVLQSGKM